jgi:hypothetical protein
LSYLEACFYARILFDFSKKSNKIQVPVYRLPRGPSEKPFIFFVTGFPLKSSPSLPRGQCEKSLVLLVTGFPLKSTPFLVSWTFGVIEGQQSSARTALWPSRPQRLICSRRRSYIPATVTHPEYPSRLIIIFQYPFCDDRRWVIFVYCSLLSFYKISASLVPLSDKGTDDARFL